MRAGRQLQPALVATRTSRVTEGREEKDIEARRFD